MKYLKRELNVRNYSFMEKPTLVKVLKVLEGSIRLLEEATLKSNSKHALEFGLQIQRTPDRECVNTLRWDSSWGQ